MSDLVVVVFGDFDAGANRVGGTYTLRSIHEPGVADRWSKELRLHREPDTHWTVERLRAVRDELWESRDDLEDVISDTKELLDSLIDVSERMERGLVGADHIDDDPCSIRSGKIQATDPQGTLDGEIG